MMKKMNSRIKKLWATCLSVVVVSGTLAVGTLPSYADTTKGVGVPDVSVSIDGELVQFIGDYGTPFVDKNWRTLVPMRASMEAYGCEVTWDEDARIAYVERTDVEVKVPIGKNYIVVNGKKVEIDTAAVIKENRTYLPIRAVFEAFGGVVDWDGEIRRVIVLRDETTKEYIEYKNNHVTRDGEMQAMWISYLEYMGMTKTEKGFKKEIGEMFDRCVEVGMNTVIVHVRSHGDAMYPSEYYPWSRFVTGTQGKNPGYDPLEYMIKEAHNRGLEFHAWINPYRITGYGTYLDQTCEDSPVNVWLNDDIASNDRWALKHKGEYYLNPSVPEVQEMVINGVVEIVENYDVDGIHFDDYFYPSMNNSDPALWFDKPEYEKSGSLLTIAEWRKDNIDDLVKGTYDAIKKADPNVEFGVSPAGNLKNLRSNTNHCVDIDRWFSKDGYVDYIMPQLYWGFEVKDSAGNVASYAYENNLNEWLKLAEKGNVDLYVGLYMAYAGTDVKDGNEVSEWLANDDIIARQVEMGREKGVNGYAYFRYEHFNLKTSESEVENLVKVLK